MDPTTSDADESSAGGFEDVWVDGLMGGSTVEV